MISLISGSSEDDEAVVSKYKALLSDIKEKQKKTDLETDMEVSFIPNDVVTEKVGDVVQVIFYSCQWTMPLTIFAAAGSIVIYFSVIDFVKVERVQEPCWSLV